MKPLKEPGKGQRYYWSVLPFRGIPFLPEVPKELGINRLWGIMYESEADAIKDYKEVEVKYDSQSNGPIRTSKTA